MVASRLDRPVLNETRLYDRIKLQFDPEDESSIAHAINSTLMVPEMRPGPAQLEFAC